MLVGIGVAADARMDRPTAERPGLLWGDHVVAEIRGLSDLKYLSAEDICDRSECESGCDWQVDDPVEVFSNTARSQPCPSFTSN